MPKSDGAFERKSRKCFLYRVANMSSLPSMTFFEKLIITNEKECSKGIIVRKNYLPSGKHSKVIDICIAMFQVSPYLIG